jgi:hypothetical protein
MAIKRSLIGPYLLHMDKTRIENVFRVAVFYAANLRPAGLNHSLHHGERI